MQAITEEQYTPPPSGTPPLVVQSISKQYKGGLWANRDISLTARPLSSCV